MKHGQLFETLSHAGVGGIKPIGNPESESHGAVVLILNTAGTYAGTISHMPDDPQEWVWTHDGKSISGNGMDSLIDTIAASRRMPHQQKMKYGDLFDAMSHAGVHGIKPVNGHGWLVEIEINGERRGVIAQFCESEVYSETPDSWVWHHGATCVGNGTGIDALLDLIRTKTEQ